LKIEKGFFLKKIGLVTLCRNDTLTLSDRERNLQDNALKFCAVWMEEEEKN